jgi:hypothetical protein
MANFQDPVGLLRRMISSGNATARSVLLRELLGIVAKPFDLLLSPAEHRWIRAHPIADAPMIIIVGGPRSGTTVTYQLLARYLPVSFVSNWVAAFHRAPITAGRLLPWTTEHYRGTDENYFGNSRGLAGPNDAFNIWNRWLGTQRRIVEQITEDAADDMRQFFSAWHAAFQKPLLNKHNRHILCMARLADVLPKAIFVIVHRDPIFMAQSLIQARALVQGTVNRGWGVLARDADASQPNSHIDVVCEQVNEIHDRIVKQLPSIPVARRCIVPYEAFCRDPAAVVENIASIVWPHQTIDLPSRIDPLEDTNQIRLPRNVIDQVQQRVTNFDFEPSLI